MERRLLRTGTIWMLTLSIGATLPACQPTPAEADERFVVADLFATPGKALATIQLTPTPPPTETPINPADIPVEPTLPLPTVVVLLQPTLPLAEFAPTERPPGASSGGGSGGNSGSGGGSVAACAPPGGPFGPIWQNISAASGLVGCPVGEVQRFDGVYQRFENGAMFWRQNDRSIFIFSERAIKAGQSTDTWWRIADTWSEAEPELDPGLEPPPGLSQPIRGFGKVWRNNGFIRESVGWAAADERFYTSEWQQFERGWMMAAPDAIPIYVFSTRGGDTTGVHLGGLPR